MVDLIHPIHVAIVAFALTLAETCHHEPVHADDWTADEVAVAALTVSECGLRADCGDVRPISWIVAHNARRRGMTLAAYVATVHHRHTRSTSRPWLAGLDATMQEPAGWPASVSWIERGAPAWAARLAAVRHALADDAHGCDGTPSVWGSPTVDLDRINRLETLGYRRLVCPRSLNVFMARRR